MIKQLLIAAAVAGMTASVGATEVTLWEGSCNFGTAWSSEDSFSVPASELAVLNDESATLKLHYTLDAACEWWQFKPCSNGEGWDALAVATELGNDYQCISVNANTTSYDLPLGAADIATIKADGLRMQGYGMTMTKITYDSDKEINENLIWEGEYTITGWNSGAEFAASKVKAGDVITYTFSEAGADTGQVLIKGSDWTNLLGTTKINQKDMAKGTVEVGVTQEMIDNCGGKIFLQGDGGPVCTKIEKTGTFDAENVLAYGLRQPGVQVFVTIPEGTEKIAVEYAETPGWTQICNTGWVDYELKSEASADGKTLTYTLTAEVLEGINSKKEFVINTDTPVVKAYIPGEDPSGVESIASENEKSVNVYDFSGRVIRMNVTPANAAEGLAKGLYIIGGKKVIIK